MRKLVTTLFAFVTWLQLLALQVVNRHETLPNILDVAAIINFPMYHPE